jgi:type IV pilus assembly protein PilP
MVLGNNNAEIRAILPGGVVLVEKLINVYDQEEYLETILPLQTTN